MTPALLDRQAASPEIIAVASQKGGVGKSTTALSLSIALVAAGHSVLLIDLDPQGDVGHTLMSGGQRIGTEQMLRDAILTRDMMSATEIPDLYLVSSGPGLSGLEGELAHFGDSRTRLLQALATLPALPFRFDHVVIDCPPAVGLLTLNALAAAHGILLPLPCETGFLDGLPTLLQTIDRLRAGLKQPLHAVHLLIVQRAASRASAQTLVRTVRQDYGRMVLRSEIPYSDAVKEAAESGRPLLAHCPHCDASQAYLELTAEWLLETEEHRQPESRWSFRSRQDRMDAYRDAMRKRIQAWLVDPTSLLYDEHWEAQHEQDALVLDELFHIKSPPRRMRLLAPLTLILILGLGFLLQLKFPTLLWWLRDGESARLEAKGLANEGVEGASARDPFSAEIESVVPDPPVVADQPITADAPDLGSVETEPVVETVAPIESSEPPEGGQDPNPAIEVDPGPLAFDGAPEVPGLLSAARETAETRDSGDVPPETLSPDKQGGGEEIRLTPKVYRWQVQILAGRSLERVKVDSQRFMQEFASMLEGRTLTISQPQGETRPSAFYRLRVLDWDTRNEAATWCGRLRDRGQECFVIGVTVEEQ